MSKKKFKPFPRDYVRAIKFYKKSMGHKNFSNLASISWKNSLARMIDHYMKEGFSSHESSQLALHESMVTYYIGAEKIQTIFVEQAQLITFLKKSKISKIDPQDFNKTLLKFVRNLGDRCFCVSWGDYSDACFVTINQSKDGFCNVVINQSEFFGISIAQDCDAQSITKSINSDEKVRGVLNLIFYISAFPEKLKSGGPQGTIKEYFIGSQMKVSYDKKIQKDEDSILVSPHLRRGHMRLLKHQRYGDNVGKWVYVRPTMVKGTAQTLEN